MLVSAYLLTYMCMLVSTYLHVCWLVLTNFCTSPGGIRLGSKMGVGGLKILGSTALQTKAKSAS